MIVFIKMKNNEINYPLTIKSMSHFNSIATLSGDQTKSQTRRTHTHRMWSAKADRIRILSSSMRVLSMKVDASFIYNSPFST